MSKERDSENILMQVQKHTFAFGNKKATLGFKDLLLCIAVCVCLLCVCTHVCVCKNENEFRSAEGKEELLLWSGSHGGVTMATALGKPETLIGDCDGKSKNRNI